MVEAVTLEDEVTVSGVVALGICVVLAVVCVVSAVIVHWPSREIDVEERLRRYDSAMAEVEVKFCPWCGTKLEVHDGDRQGREGP